MSRLRVACVGTGFIARKHLAALTAEGLREQVEVVAVADAARDRAEAVAAGTGARAYDDGLALLATEELDAVWLCVPPSAHGPLELSAVERGLPFFVEKPLSVDLAAPLEVAAAVRARGLLTCVGYHWRSLSTVAEALRLVRQAPVQALAGRWFDGTPPAPWWSQRSGSGGQLVEQTTHLVDLARLLVGEVEAVSAVEGHLPREQHPGADVPTASAVVLQFVSGAVGTLTSSCVLGRRHEVGLQLVTEPRLLSLSERTLSDHDLLVADAEGERRVHTDEDPVAHEDRAFVAALRTGSPVPVTYDDALRSHAVALAADRSARDGGARVRVDELLAGGPAGA